MAQIQLVGVLFDLQGLDIPRLVCRLSLEGEVREYHVYVDRRTAREVDHLLDERPFRALRLDRSQAASLNYVGDLQWGTLIDELSKESANDKPILYLELAHGRSRRKYKLPVPEQVIQQFHWLLELNRHDDRQGRHIIEA